MHPHFSFKTIVWKYQGESPWYFATLPKNVAEQVKQIQNGTTKTPFGSVRVVVQCGTTKWQTSIFPDNSRQSYLLPIKKEVRVKENIQDQTLCSFMLWLEHI